MNHRVYLDINYKTSKLRVKEEAWLRVRVLNLVKDWTRNHFFLSQPCLVLSASDNGQEGVCWWLCLLFWVRAHFVMSPPIEMCTSPERRHKWWSRILVGEFHILGINSFPILLTQANSSDYLPVHQFWQRGGDQKTCHFSFYPYNSISVMTNGNWYWTTDTGRQLGVPGTLHLEDSRSAGASIFCSREGMWAQCWQMLLLKEDRNLDFWYEKYL